MLARNIASMTALSLYRNAVQFGMNIAVAAFISPADYGLVAFTAPFLSLLGMLTDMGMSSAVTRAQQVDRYEAGAAFVATVLGGTGCGVLLACLAFPLQGMIRMAGLAPVMIAMSSTIVLGITASIPRAMLERRLCYHRIARIEAAAIAIGAIFGLTAAWHGGGVWSLVLYNVVNQTIRAAAMIHASRHDFVPNLRLSRLGGLLSLGGWVLANNLLGFVARSSDNLLIGITLGAAAVGVYGLSYQFMLAPLMAITWPSSAILLATLRDEHPGGERAAKMIAGVMSATAILTFPAMIYLTFGLSFPVQALLSARWHGVPGIVAWLAPVGALQSIASYNGAVLMIAGKARAQFLLTVGNTLVLLTTFVVALPFGLDVLVRAYAVVATVLACGFLWTIVHLSSLGWRGLGAALAAPLLASGLGLATVSMMGGYRSETWTSWGASTALYGVVVLAVYGAMHARIRPVIAVLGGRVPHAATEI